MNRARVAAAVAAAVSVGAVVVFALLVRAYWVYTVDDTYIFLRYARHLATGAGLTWNAGEAPAEGYTSFAWTVLLALPHLVRVDAVVAAKAMSVGCMLAAAGAAARLAWRLGEEAGVDVAGRWLAAGVTAMLVLTPFAAAVHAVSGMETALATLLVTLYGLGIARVVRDRDRSDGRAPWAMTVCGLGLGLTRPEGNLLVVVATVVLVASLPRGAHGRVVRAFAVGHVAPGALYFAWRLVRYRHLLPLPFYVKAVAPTVTLAGAPECLELLRLVMIAQPWIGVPLVVGIAGARRCAAVRAIVAGVAAWWLFFLLPAHEMGYDLRYLWPLVPSLMAIAGAGVARLHARVAARVPSVVPAALLSIAIAATAYRHLDGSLAEKRDYGGGVLRAHAALGRALAASRPAGPRAVVAALDCGAMAYYADGWSVIDTWGLNDPEIALAAAHGGRSAERILQRDPTVVVVISQRRDAFVPHFDYEGPLYTQALARGYRHESTYAFLPDYQLWVLRR